jgi:hypothetical protein|tara:strand:- start:21349 stop:21807 length:459 start_codon:yes stop_codon:yes gene_type:complete
MERVIQCPICFDQDACFEDTQPDFKSYMCFNCGFMSNSQYTEENLEKIENTTQLVNELKKLDEERQIYWYPSVVNMGPKGIIFPEGTEEQWVWKYAKVVEIPKEEQEQYPIPDKDGEFYTTKLDVEGAKTFGQYDFMEACKTMGITVEQPNA